MNYRIVVPFLFLILLGSGCAGCTKIQDIAAPEKVIVVTDTYIISPESINGHERYMVVDSTNTTYQIADGYYPYNSHIFYELHKGYRYGVKTDGTTIFSMTKWNDEAVFDQKSVRLLDGRWIRDERTVREMLASGQIRNPASAEWVLRGYWTNTYYYTTPEIWERVRLYTPRVPSKFEEPGCRYRSLIGQKDYTPFGTGYATFIYDIENFDEYDQFMPKNPVNSSPVTPQATWLSATTATIVSRSAAVSTTTSSPGMLVRYDFEDDFIANGTLIDRSGMDRDARVSGTVRAGPGIRGSKGILFSGNGYLLAPDNPAAGKKEVTFSFWFLTEHPEQNYKFASAAVWRGGPGSGWTLATHVPEFWSDDKEEGVLVPAQENRDNGFVPGTWTHEAVVYDGRTMKEYTNGTLINTWQSRGVPLSAGVPMAVGGWPQFTAYNFVGCMDDFRIYNRALSASEIRGLYTAGQG